MTARLHHLALALAVVGAAACGGSTVAAAPTPSPSVQVATPTPTPSPTATMPASPTPMAPMDPVAAPRTTPTPVPDPTTPPATPTPDPASTPRAAAATITIDDFAFDVPDAVEPGATIEVRNDDDLLHTITAKDGSFDEQAPRGTTLTITAPSDPGDYDFFCQLHAGMSAVLTVS